MKHFIVRVTETLARTWVVKAESEDEAWKKVDQAYSDGELILDYDDYSEYDIEVKREAKNNELTFYDILEDDE